MVKMHKCQFGKSMRISHVCVRLCMDFNTIFLFMLIKKKQIQKQQQCLFDCSASIFCRYIRIRLQIIIDNRSCGTSIKFHSTLVAISLIKGFIFSERFMHEKRCLYAPHLPPEVQTHAHNALSDSTTALYSTRSSNRKKNRSKPANEDTFRSMEETPFIKLTAKSQINQCVYTVRPISLFMSFFCPLLCAGFRFYAHECPLDV